MRQILILLSVWLLVGKGFAQQPQVLATWPVSVPLCYLSFMSDGTYETDTTGVWSYRHAFTPAYMPGLNNNVLFQCNGNVVANKSGQFLDGGVNLTDPLFYSNYYQAGNTITQSTVILPKRDSTYWIFYYSFSDSLWNTGTGSPDRLYYAVVDMKANGGTGKVIEKKVPIYKGVMGDCRLTAVRHGNGRDWWLINHGYVNAVYNKYLVTPDTILGPYQQVIGTPDAEPDLIGSAQFAPDGTKYASGNIGSPLNLMDFDRCTGEFSNVRSVKVFAESPWPPSTTNSIVDGLCFSPSGRYLYTTSLKYLLQFDTWADTIENTRTLIAKVDSTYKNSSPFFTMFISPHDKIIVSNYQGAPINCNLHTIEAPDSAGLACNFQKESLAIPGALTSYTLPNIVDLKLDALPACDTIIWDAIPEHVNTEEKQIRIFPNPADERVFIETQGYGTGGTLQITDALGRSVYINQHFDETTAIRVSNWQSGVYYWHLSQEQRVIGNGKLVVKH